MNSNMHEYWYFIYTNYFSTVIQIFKLYLKLFKTYIAFKI